MAYKKPRPQAYKLHIRRGNSGLGLFAGEQIPKDKFIVEYYGPLLNDEQADKKSGKYLFEVDKHITIDGSSRNNIARYINHSCKPNCEPEIDGKRIFIYAIRDIEAGEEITYNYGKEYYNGFIKPNGCKCGHHRKRAPKRNR